jgi:hypothetical protein
MFEKMIIRGTEFYLTKLLKMQCFACKNEFKALKSCARCHAGLYCSKKCQVEHWPTHKSNCKEVRNKCGEYNVTVADPLIPKKVRPAHAKYLTPALLIKVSPTVYSKIIDEDTSSFCPFMVQWKSASTGKNNLQTHLFPSYPMLVETDYIEPSDDDKNRMPSIGEWVEKLLFMPKQHRKTLMSCDPILLFNFSCLSIMHNLPSVPKRLEEATRIAKAEGISRKLCKTLSDSLDEPADASLKFASVMQMAYDVPTNGSPTDMVARDLLKKTIETTCEIPDQNYMMYLRKRYSKNIRHIREAKENIGKLKNGKARVQAIIY